MEESLSNRHSIADKDKLILGKYVRSRINSNLIAGRFSLIGPRQLHTIHSATYMLTFVFINNVATSLYDTSTANITYCYCLTIETGETAKTKRRDMKKTAPLAMGFLMNQSERRTRKKGRPSTFFLYLCSGKYSIAQIQGISQSILEYAMFYCCYSPCTSGRCTVGQPQQRTGDHQLQLQTDAKTCKRKWEWELE